MKIIQVQSGGTVLYGLCNGPGFSLSPKEVTVSAPRPPQQPSRPATPPPQQPQPQQPAPARPAPQAPPPSAPTPAAPRQGQYTADPWAAEVR
jgi:hypothetical protein